MDFTFYALLTLACLVLVLAMWACAASNTSKWGPDTTLDLPPHLWQEVLFKNSDVKPPPRTTHYKIVRPAPSAPTEHPSAPLLCHELPPAGSLPRKPPLPPKPVRVLPSHFVHPHPKSFHPFILQEDV